MPSATQSRPAAAARSFREGTPVSSEALSVLASLEIAGDVARITAGELARPVYEEVNEVLNRLGGVWKKGKGHVFAFYNPAPLLATLVAHPVMPAKNPTAFFPTPQAVVALVMDLAGIDGVGELFVDIGREFRVLEPSAGSGAFARAIREASPAARLDVVEALDLNASLLRAQGFDVHEQDFLSFTPGAVYDRIVMNPPFSLAGQPRAFMDHIEHAFSLLREGGRLLAIVPTGWTAQDAPRARVFRDFVFEYGSYEPLPAGSFMESGTGVDTALVMLEKVSDLAARRPEFNTHHCFHCWRVAVEMENDWPRAQAIDALFAAGTDEAETRDALRDLVQTYGRRPESTVVLLPQCIADVIRYFAMCRAEAACVLEADAGQRVTVVSASGDTVPPAVPSAGGFALVDSDADAVLDQLWGARPASQLALF
jgi:hypothetical protein